MKVINNERVVMVDVDDTLVIWNKRADLPGVQIPCPHDGRPISLRIHEPHLKLLKNHKARGYTIIVWSAGGYEWARSVVMALGLSAYVDFVMTKPLSYVDDLPVEAWMNNRIYLDPLGPWGIE